MKIYENLNIVNLDEEIWKFIQDFPDYQVSNYGRVKSLKFRKEKILKPGKCTGGYLFINLRKNKIPYNILVHKLVAETFIDSENKSEEINHINGIKIDNISNNLEFIKHIDNIKHARDKLGCYIGENNSLSKLKNEEVWLIKKILNSDYYNKFKKINQTFIGKMFKVSRRTISNINNEKTWSHIKIGFDK